MRQYTFLLAMLAALCLSAVNPSQYVDPKIGSEGLGRVFVGPSMPYGMIKPSVDACDMPNSGWLPTPEPVCGFAQTHVSGTGGGQKYGNVLLMPFTGPIGDKTTFADTRASETIELGYYATRLEQSGIGVEITTANKVAIYRIDYPEGQERSLALDAGFFLGMSPIPDQRETQQFVGSQIEIVSDREIRGYTRVRGGWNNGRAYTVYFCAVSDEPFVACATWKGDKVSDALWQSDTHEPTGALVTFGGSGRQVSVKIAISYLGELRAYENLMEEIPGWDFDGTRQNLLDAWDELLGRIELDSSTPDRFKRMFYTGLYHTMIMPVDRSGENPLWSDDSPYYDDFYAIWDTYRTSSPMITILDPQRETDIVNSLINIAKRDGFMPDARSGNANGRTQGGSNAEIVIADACVKGLEGIDYEQALEAMLKDADVAPGGNEEAEGRGGLREYNTLGYVPFGIPRAGNRTVEYAYCDYAIAQVAKKLGRDDIYQRFIKQSENWKNLWRDDYEHAGSKGFIMPRDEQGQWLDTIPFGHSTAHQPTYQYHPMIFEGPWYTPWWSMFFYEAPSWEYSLSVPHDVPGLIEKCGGPEAFEQRLDTFFDRDFYNVNNEPSFLSPCLYHWIGKPWRSSQRVREIVGRHFDDTPNGLPGNDDSGAMSSWLAFHILGLYPNAGQDYYLINSPMVKTSTIHLANGRDFTIEARGLSDKNTRIKKMELNGEPLAEYRLTHQQLMQGGKLVLTMGKEEAAEQKPRKEKPAEPVYLDRDQGQYLFTFKLHGQTRRYRVAFEPTADGGMAMRWGIERNLQWQSGEFVMTAQALRSADVLSFRMPVNGENVTLPDNETAYVLSRDSYQALVAGGQATICGLTFRVEGRGDGELRLVNDSQGMKMRVLADADLPLIVEIANSPFEINYTARPLR